MRALPTSPGWPRSWPAMGSCPAASPSAASDWRSAPGSSPWPSLAIAILVAFGGTVDTLIPLYAIGVFTSITLSQAGMVRHWLRERGPDWRRSAAINGFGAVATAIVTVVSFAIAKFALGAWIYLRGRARPGRHHRSPSTMPTRWRPSASGRQAGSDHPPPQPSAAGRGRGTGPHTRRRAGDPSGHDDGFVTSMSSTSTADLEDGERFRERVERQVPNAQVVTVGNRPTAPSSSRSSDISRCHRPSIPPG